jgi:hypothetical protein
MERGWPRKKKRATKDEDFEASSLIAESMSIDELARFPK